VTSLLDEVLPSYDVNEIHSTRVGASPEAALAAVKSVTAKEIRLLGPLMAIRMLPSRLRHGPRLDRATDAPVLDQFLHAGFVVLGERPASELVVGAVGRFWSLGGNAPLKTIRAREDFVAFAEPGHAKAAMNFLVVPDEGGTRIVTETRVAGTSAEATKSFRRYWRVIRLGSGAIRRSWLAAIRRRVERRDTFSLQSV
jgi:hypothetical protein